MIPPQAEWRVKRLSRLPDRPCAEGLLEAGVDALPVRVLVQQDGFVTGWDDGAMGFEDDAVWFSGEMTSFRVVVEDIVAANLDRREAESMTVTRLLHLGFPLRHPSRVVSVRVAVLEAPGRREWQDEERLAMEISRLWRQDESMDESQYPPLRVRPGAAIFHADPLASTASVAGLNRIHGTLGALLRILFPPSPMLKLGYGHGLARLERALAEESCA